MRLGLLAFAAVGAAALVSPAGAEPAAVDRYQIQPADDGFMRVDRETGATAFCSPSGEGYACRAADESKAAPGDDVARLEKRIAALEQQVKALAPPAPAAGSGLPPVPQLPKDMKDRDPTLGLPTQEQMDRVAGFLQRALKKLKGLAEDTEKQDQPKGERL